MIKKIRFHYTYYIIVFSFLFTGQFLNLIIITSLILIHELGHYLACVFTKVFVREIVIYPYGGITKIDDVIDIDFKKELLISVSGVIFQSLFYLIIFFLHKNYLIRDYTMQIFYKYHFSMIIFNLIPIYPLDGSKIINIFINRFFSFRLSNIILIIISFFNVLLITFIFRVNYSYVMIIGILINYIINYARNIKYIYNRFLLEKYLYNRFFKRKKIIDNKNKMYRNVTHLVRVDKKYYTEMELLKKMFD